MRLPQPSKTIDCELKQEVDLELQREDHNSPALRHGYIILLLAMSVAGMWNQSVSTYMTKYLVSIRGLTESMASLIYGLNPVMGILGSLSGGYLADRVGSKRWMIMAYLGGVIVFTGIYLSPLWALIVIYFVGGYFGGSTMGPSSSLVAEFSPRKRRGLAYAIFMLPFSLVGAISPIIAAKIIESYEISTLFPFAICLSIASIPLLQLLPETRQQKT